MRTSYIKAGCWRGMLALAVFCTLFGVAGPQALWAQALTIRSVAVSGAANEPEIEVKSSGPVAPATQAVTDPDRIVIDFPGALPASTLRGLHVHRGSLKGIRTGLFQSQPPITRVVLDVDGPTDYQVMPSGNSIVIKLGRSSSSQAAAAPHPAVQRTPVQRSAVQRSTLRVPALQITNTVAVAVPAVVKPAAAVTPAVPARPKIDVGVRSNLLSIHTEGATLAAVLFEVHRRTGAEIVIPAGAEHERVVVDMGLAPGKEVIASLLNGSRFNYIIVGSDGDPGGFRNVLLSLKSGDNSSASVPGTQPLAGSQPYAMSAPPHPGVGQPGLDPSAVTEAEPELEPVPDDSAASDANPETNPNNSRPVAPQQFPVQNTPDAGQPPQ